MPMFVPPLSLSLCVAACRSSRLATARNTRGSATQHTAPRLCRQCNAGSAMQEADALEKAQKPDKLGQTSDDGVREPRVMSYGGRAETDSGSELG